MHNPITSIIIDDEQDARQTKTTKTVRTKYKTLPSPDSYRDAHAGRSLLYK